jgi:hypothetical protein
VYTTCLFCNGPLGRNESIEAFPVGRRLAFDGARGRLWVVCRTCERWNLTPIEERWEAIEQCERAFRETRLRVSTDHIGMARLREGLELVRIGEPQRPEMAAWRYGDQFGRRRRRTLLYGAGSGVVAFAILTAGPMMGLASATGMGLLNVWNVGRAIYLNRSTATQIPNGDRAPLVVHRDQVQRAALNWEGAANRWSLDVSHRRTDLPDTRWWQFEDMRAESNLVGDDALRAARLLLPAVNAAGAKRTTVDDAVQYLGDTPAPEVLFARVARDYTERGNTNRSVLLSAIPAPVRLALEMSAHEETERRALEGELHMLESAWRDAEEIAAIADDLFLPETVEAELQRLKRSSG